MGEFLNRLKGKSLQIGSGGYFSRMTGSAGIKLPTGGSLQQTIYEFRSNIKASVDGMVSPDGIIQRGIVSNIIPNARSIRLVPPPPATPEVTEPAGRGLSRMSSASMQVPYEDVQALQFSDPRDVEALGGDDLRIYVN